MKKNRKSYESMVNGWLEVLRDYDRWRDAHYEASPKYVASNSNAHAYQLEASYDIMSDD